MRMVVQRVSKACVRVEDRIVGRIGHGLVVLLGIAKGDTPAQADQFVDKLVHLRVFPDDNQRMNRSLLQTGGSLLVVSQFTLYGDARKGRRPSFDRAAPPEEAKRLYEYFLEAAAATGVPVEAGLFQAMMEVELVNEGPVTILCDSEG